MTKIVVLFNLKAGVDADEYHRWARSVDIPTVSGLSSVQGFGVFKSQGTLAGTPAPYEYVEIIDTVDMDALGRDISTPEMQKVAGEFQQFADNPIFMLTESL